MRLSLALSTAMWLAGTIASPTPKSDNKLPPTLPLVTQMEDRLKAIAPPSTQLSRDGKDAGDCVALVYEITDGPDAEKGVKDLMVQVNLYGPDGKRFHTVAQPHRQLWKDTYTVHSKGTPMKQDFVVNFLQSEGDGAWDGKSPSNYQKWIVSFRYGTQTWKTKPPHDDTMSIPYYETDGWKDVKGVEAPIIGLIE
ncbi:hypothetical protein NUU61_006957 [Penicillium alfredii]|uniref:Uncharacterized protein n=1 Tax=Penicillium alfredii TaxID=1506179 RepID=A0A9W9K4R7_9EURO|nr:uncharacterized protein NUU61_006957 [Penicillium alfredii]KAJ5092087.1 hypothetical protein NUU61_006957 [Penicillium alfredii]